LSTEKQYVVWRQALPRPAVFFSPALINGISILRFYDRIFISHGCLSSKKLIELCHFLVIFWHAKYSF